MEYKIRDYKVLALPTIGVPNSRYYFLKNNGTVEEYITDKQGAYKLVGSASIGGSGNSSLYNQELIGIRDGFNHVFTVPNNFIIKTTRIYLNGSRLKIGLAFDYIESGAKEITFNSEWEILASDNLIIDYDPQT